MRGDLSPVLAALESASHPVDCFIRDDDAGWDSEALFALLDLTQAAGVPIDLAVIPAAVDDALTHRLIERIDARPGRLGIHQHGLSHANHQTDLASGGRKCEFGPARGPEAQQLDLLRGQALLHERFGSRVDAIFTPPWNRCATHTPELLAGLGWAALSRDRGATPQHELRELPVDLDWSRAHRQGGAAAVAEAWAARLRERLADGRAFGLMLHHAAMDGAERALLGRWLAALSTHPRLRWRAMRALLSEPAV